MLWRLPDDLDLLYARLRESDDVVMWHRPLQPEMLRQDFTQQLGFDAKPRGIWYACGTDWLRFIDDNRRNWWSLYAFERGVHVYILDIDKDWMLPIESEDAFSQFTRRYGVTSEQLGEIRSAVGSARHAYRLVEGEPAYINWREVAKGYDGIEICPARKKRLRWYETWDAASGCIWQPSIIREVRELMK